MKLHTEGLDASRPVESVWCQTAWNASKASGARPAQRAAVVPNRHAGGVSSGRGPGRCGRGAVTASLARPFCQRLRGSVCGATRAVLPCPRGLLPASLCSLTAASAPAPIASQQLGLPPLPQAARVIHAPNAVDPARCEVVHCNPSNPAVLGVVNQEMAETVGGWLCGEGVGWAVGRPGG